MATLHILRGVSGSGKSTLARNMNAVRVCRDELRESLYGTADQDYFAAGKEVVAQREAAITVVQDALIGHHLAQGADVVVDNTNVEWKFVKALAEIARLHQADVKIKVIDVPLKVAIERNKARGDAGGRRVPEDVIRQQHQRLQATKDKELDEFKVEPYVADTSNPKAWLVDLDGTLFHNNGKRGFYDWMKVGGDDVDESVKRVVNALWKGTGDYIILMSGRDEVCREVTEDALERAGISYDELFMRARGDMRKDNIVKYELFNEHVRDKFNVIGAIDDRWQVVRDVWLALGIKTFNVSGLDRGEF